MIVKRRMAALQAHEARTYGKENVSTYLTKLNSGMAPDTPWKSIVSAAKSGSWLWWLAVLRFHSPPLFFPPFGICPPSCSSWLAT